MTAIEESIGIELFIKRERRKMKEEEEEEKENFWYSVQSFSLYADQRKGSITEQIHYFHSFFSFIFLYGFDQSVKCMRILHLWVSAEGQLRELQRNLSVNTIFPPFARKRVVVLVWPDRSLWVPWIEATNILFSIGSELFLKCFAFVIWFDWFTLKNEEEIARSDRWNREKRRRKFSFANDSFLKSRALFCLYEWW